MTAFLPLGDQAVLAYCPDEAAASRCAAAVRRHHFPWLVDVVQAYTSVAVFFDLDRIRYPEVAAQLETCADTATSAAALAPGRLHRIPCCYDLQLDLDRVAAHTALPA